MSLAVEAPRAATAPAALLPLLRELGDLKRVRSAQYDGSLAERRFRAAWGALVAGAPAADVALAVTAGCVAAARLGDLDRHVLGDLGVDETETRRILEDAFDAVTGAVPEPLNGRLRGALDAMPPPGEAPPFVDKLARQPRAGVTRPGRPRVVLEPPENHAEHCLMAAVYGVLLSPSYGADPEAVFFAGLAHHLHNAAMPDSGFTGEVLLGPELDAVIARSRARAAGELPPALRERALAACAGIADDRTPEARAFHAADVIDRVLQIEQHLRAASLTMDAVLHDFELVHEGPVKPFHDRVLGEMGLL